MKKLFIALLWLSCGFVVANAQNYIKTTTFNTTNIVDVEYHDGLGRLDQTVQVAASPLGKSIITPYWHDSQGREDARSYLPYVSDRAGSLPSANLIAEQEAYYRGIYGNGEVRNFVEKVYETSPLNRPLTQQMPGAVFEQADKKTIYGYSFNQSGDVFLLKHDESSGNIAVQGSYPANTLFCNEITDEDGAKKATYFNIQQQKVLERSFGVSGAAVDTYYIYNDRGLLCWVIQPEGSALLSASGSITPESDVAKKFCFRYYYDGRGRMIERQMPGRAVEYLIYDRNDRVVMTQDGVFRTQNKWKLDRFNSFGQLYVRRIIVNLGSREALQNLFDIGEESVIYRKHPADQQILVYQYDLASSNVDAELFVEIPGVVTQSDLDTRTNGLLTYTRARVLAQDGVTLGRDAVSQYFYYDYRGRIIQTVTLNHLGGISRISCRYDQLGNVLVSHESHQTSVSATPDVLLTRYTYDSRGRKLTQTAALNGSSASADVSYTYDGLGKLVGRQYGDPSYNLREHYNYNLQGWETARLNPGLDTQLYYYDPVTPGTTPSYTGNISEMNWIDQGDGSDRVLHTYTYQYDLFKRLTDSKLYDNGVQTDAYVEHGITYDRNGNILTMGRTIAGQLNRALDYDYNGNQVTSVARILPRKLFEYDANGNCTFDGSNSLQITYNLLNLSQRVSKMNGTTTDYLYSADKAKLGSRNILGYGYDYLGSLVYKTDASGCKLESASFDGGRIKAFEMEPSIPVDTIFQLTTKIEIIDRPVLSRKMYIVQYSLTDHLGSVRVITNKEGRVLGRNNYYPFGKRWNDDGSAAFDRWLFNGKESQDGFGLDMLDYGARMYDPDIGRWLTQDPHLESYVNHSPYVYCINNPMNLIDPTGEDIYFLQSNGRMILGLLTDDAADRIYGLNNGHVDGMNFTDVGKGFMESYWSGREKVYNATRTAYYAVPVSYYENQNFMEAKRTFEFLADNSDVEWGMASDSYTNHIYTSHEATKLRGDVNYLFGNNPFSHTHSHQKSSKPSGRDIKTATQLSNILYKIYYKQQYNIYGQNYFVPFSQFSFY